MQRFGRRSAARGWALALPRPGWKSAGVLALLCSGVAWASLPHIGGASSEDRQQWQALAIAPLSGGGATGIRMAASNAVQPVDFVPKRAIPVEAAVIPTVSPAVVAAGPLRIRGRVGDGLYWSLRAAGATPQVAAQYLSALATEIDVGEVSPNASFDMVLGPGANLLYAGLNRIGEPQLQLVKWTANGRSEWIDAANADRPAPVQSGLMMPVAGRITSYFGYRYHPILHFTRFHAGLDIGASWGSPIVAAADGQVAAAGWAGGYGREVRIAHAGGLMTLYGHMSEIVAQPGSYVRAGQLIGYVGSSGLSTGPHVHFEVRQNGTPVNPMTVRFSSVQVADAGLVNAVKARLKVLLSVGVKRA
ncbi:MAG TPA: M23 family metallopeptidase [Sphingomicrobium sp.]|jgi:murein DD-endopeptidase MepM/ murein hydrolase activator NlpD|nr:M23 family metallopeptidase [Sphingomicrobium sp.]